MTKQEFAEWAGRETIILDGATGSNLIKAGLGRGVCTEQWILEHPQVLIDLQRAYADAGSNIVYAPTFAANRMNLKYYGLDENIRQMNHDRSSRVAPVTSPPATPTLPRRRRSLAGRPS